MANKIIGNGGVIADVDSSRNIFVNTPGYDATGVERAGGSENAGAVASFSENDPGTLTGARLVKSPETSFDYRLRVGTDTMLFNDTFNATSQNTSVWSYTFSTLTASQPGIGTLNFGTVQGTAATHGAFMKTFQYFPLIGTAPLSVEIKWGQFTAPLVANEVWRAGLGNPTVAGTAPTDGVWFNLTSAGLIGEVTFNGVTTPTAVLASLASVVAGNIYKWVIVIGEAQVEFWRDDVLLASVLTNTANGQPFLQGSLPVFMQKLCTGVVSNTNTMRVSDISVYLLDIATAKPWSQQLALSGQVGNLGQNGQTQGKTSLWANNTAPTALTLSNGGAAFTGLGGIAAILPTFTANSDGIIFGYQNPASTINITGKNLVITGVKIQGAVSVIFAGGPVIYAYAIAYGNLAAGLATTETASFANNTTHAPRIVPIGMETYPVTSAVGTLGAGATISLQTPIVVRPGEFVQIIARNIGVVTTTGAITVVCTVDSYWE